MLARLLFNLRRYLLTVLAIAPLSYSAAAIADVLILRDGSRIQGKVTFCDEEHCVVSTKGFALDQIARIELQSGVAVPAAAGAGSIVMVDGTVKAAQFTGLNLGVVNVNGAEIDRDQVAVIILAGPPPASGGPAAVPGDLLIMADGTRRVGRLTTCTAASCRLDSKLVPLNAVRWIGLLGEGGAPPQAEDTADIIFRKEQAVGARLGGIDATTVRSTRGNFAREDVLWIHLAPPLKDEPTSGRIIVPEPPTEPQPPPPPPPQPARGGSSSDKGKDTTSPPSRPASGGSSSDKGKDKTSGRGKTLGTPGALWTGTIEGEKTVTITVGKEMATHHYTAHFEVRLREHDKKPMYAFSAKPPYRRIVGWEAELWNEGTRVDATYDGRYVAGPQICSDRASTTYSDEEHEAGYYRWKSVPDALVGYEDVPMDGIYGLFMGTCCWDPCGIDYYRFSHYALQNDLISIGFAPGPNGEYPMDVQPPRYHHMNAGHTRMTGSFDVVSSDACCNDHVKVSWNLCKEGSGACTPLSDGPQEKKDPCGPPTTERAILDTIWNQRQMKVHELEEHWKELQKTNQTMLDNLPAWQTAMPLCAIEEIGKKIAEAVIGHLGGEAAEFTETIAKMVTGDLTFIFKGQLEGVGDALENDKNLIDGATGPGNPKSMEEKLADCPALTEDLKSAAKAFVDAYAEMPGLMRRVKTDINDVRSKDQQYWDQWQKYYERCLEYAKCKGIPPSDCHAPPDQPSGPMPGQKTSEPTPPPR